MILLMCLKLSGSVNNWNNHPHTYIVVTAECFIIWTLILLKILPYLHQTTPRLYVTSDIPLLTRRF